MNKNNTKKYFVVFIIIFSLINVSFVTGFKTDYTYQDSNFGLYSFYPTDDACIQQTSPNNNYGTGPELAIRNYGGGSWAFYSLIKFDLSPIPSDADIITAKLWCYFSDWYDNDPAGNSAVLYRLLGDWDEGAVTWNNQPSASSSSSASSTIPSSTGVWMQWTVTNDVQSFVDGTNNYGWRMTDTTYWPGIGIPCSKFHSKEGGNSPWLEVEYKANQPPNKPSRPSGPSSLEVGKEGTFSTVATDPDGDMVRYGWDWNSDMIIDEWTGYYQSGKSINIKHSWSEIGQYYIRVKTQDTKGQTSGFSLSKKITIFKINDPPLTPNTPEGNISLGIGETGTYSTSSIDPDCDSIKYGWDWNGDNTVDEWTEYFESGVEINTNHTWNEPGIFNLKVIAEDDEGSQSNFSSFLTVLVNDPPQTPTINGKLKGNTGTSYSYSIITTDPNDDKIYYMIDWDDGNITDWKGSYNSGETVNISHVWINEGTYFMKVKAKDIHGAESDWSSFEVKMPKSISKNPFYQLLLKLLELFPVLQNILNL